ncbi:MAG: Zn-dependent hydrolase [Anaerolineae bacterium]
MVINNLVNLKINAERLRANFEELGQIGATIDGGISRLALSNEDLEARAWLANQFESAGLIIQDDDAGNLSGIYYSAKPGAKTLLLGSHMDSVKNAGRYDSSIGILAALECVRTLKEAEVELPVHVEAINFTDEEGYWRSLFGSRALTGNLENTRIEDKSVDTVQFRAALFRAGIRPSDVHQALRNPATLAGYLQLHIEQGYRLHQWGIDIGVVTGIVGRSTYEITFYGEASHSGTTSPEMRRDALQGAASYITAAYEMVAKEFPDGVFNCGNVVVEPGAFNIIPAESRLTVECRHPQEEVVVAMESALIRLAQEQAIKYRLSVNTRRVIHMPAAVMSDWMIGKITASCEKLACTYTPLIGYAGHDAQIMSNFTPTGMIFIPTVDGISHSPREYSEWEHVLKGTTVLLYTILAIAQDFR